MEKVLIVGGRATGLMMTAELARRGIEVRCIDKSVGIDPHVRANLLHSRTLEIFQSLGIAEQVLQGSVAEEGLVFYRGGQVIGESPHQPIDSPFPFGMSQSQAHVEATMEAHLNSLGTSVERSVALTGADQDENGINVALVHQDGREEHARYDWLVACDGAHSEVRHLTGTAFPGESDPFPYILGDVMVAGGKDLEPTKGHVFFHDTGELFLFTRLPDNRQFIVANLDPETSTDGEATLEELQAIVAERGRSNLRISDPHWLAYFHINYRLAPHYRKGRVLLAGDAAHVHSLLAGQGMNTGIQDAYNLAWKLALVVKGQASVDLLDSYESERREVADGVVNMTREITDTMEGYASLSHEEREKLIAHLFTPEAERLDAARHLQEVDLDYRASRLTLDTNEAFSGGPAPGAQAPDAEKLLVDGVELSLYLIPADDQYRLLFFQGMDEGETMAIIEEAANTAMPFASWLKPYIVARQSAESVREPGAGHTIIHDQHGALHDTYGAQSPCIYLIRPDGYIAYRSLDIRSIDQYFEHIKIGQGYANKGI
ncbi:MAG: FAD-dependent monooxygenase [Pseudomonadota bacterium]